MKKIIKCKNCGKEFYKKRGAAYCSRACKKQATEKRLSSALTLCWSCDNACGRCEWSAFFIPVKGWNAERSEIKNLHKGTAYESYHVYECPKYVPDRRRSMPQCSEK